MNEFTPEQLESDIQLLRNAVSEGMATPKQLESLLTIKADLANANKHDWKLYDNLIQHLPDPGSSSLLVVIKGHLLIEQLMERFIKSRFHYAEAFDKARVSFAQKCWIGESLCLPTNESSWLWEQIRELNTIRNKFAHKLETAEFEVRIEDFVRNFDRHQPLHGANLNGVISRLYGMLKGLCEVSEFDNPIAPASQG